MDKIKEEWGKLSREQQLSASKILSAIKRNLPQGRQSGKTTVWDFVKIYMDDPYKNHH
jgi:hypothetical protein